MCHHLLLDWLSLASDVWYRREIKCLFGYIFIIYNLRRVIRTIRQHHQLGIVLLADTVHGIVHIQFWHRLVLGGVKLLADKASHKGYDYGIAHCHTSLSASSALVSLFIMVAWVSAGSKAKIAAICLSNSACILACSFLI